jgi:hypothetical protein
MEASHCLMKYLNEGDLHKVPWIHNPWKLQVKHIGLTLLTSSPGAQETPAVPRVKTGLHTTIHIVIKDAPLQSCIQAGDNGYNAADIALADQVLPCVFQTFEAMLFTESPMDTIYLMNHQDTCGERNPPLPVNPMLLTGNFHIIFYGARDSEDDIFRDYPNLAAVSEACSLDLWRLFNPCAGKNHISFLPISCQL